MEKPRRTFRNAAPILHRYLAEPRAQSQGRRGVQEPVGILQLLHYSRRYLVRLLARQFALLYYKERRVSLGRVQKTTSTDAAKSTRQTVYRGGIAPT